jgi:protein-S-isoprenylcysteine O-methyltransferase Ste14
MTDVNDQGEIPPVQDAERVRRIGWGLVAVQALLLALLLVLPKRRGLLVPPDILDVLGAILMIAGLAVVLIAFVSMGGALTPTPIPQEGAALRTHGIYAFVRHPIYVGVLLAALGFTLAVGSIWQVVIWLLLVIFFAGKALWEDRLLAERHGVTWYDYADHVGGFVPRFWGSR